jgi:hypothetical protein
VNQKKRDFVPLKKVIKEVLKEIEKSAGDQREEMARIWREVVGEELAALTRVRAVSPRGVEIEASSSAVLAEVKQFYRVPFVEKLKEEGKAQAERISFSLSDR